MGMERQGEGGTAVCELARPQPPAKAWIATWAACWACQLAHDQPTPPGCAHSCVTAPFSHSTPVQVQGSEVASVHLQGRHGSTEVTQREQRPQ